MDYFTDAMRRWDDFRGVASRTEFWMFVLIWTVLTIGIAIIDAILTGGIIYIVYLLATLVPIIAITTRRLHDMGYSGWWQLISFVPGIGSLILLIMLVFPTNPDSDYGD